MAGVSETNRKKIAALLIGLGAGLILIGFLFFLSQPPAETLPLPTTRNAVPLPTRARAMKQLLFWLVVFLLIFGVSTLTFLRWSRRFRDWILRKPHAPTPSEDVWAMHKLPEGAIEEWTDADAEGPDDPRPED